MAILKIRNTQSFLTDLNKEKGKETYCFQQKKSYLKN